jgi:hypothetical protein
MLCHCNKVSIQKRLLVKYTESRHVCVEAFEIESVGGELRCASIQVAWEILGSHALSIRHPVNRLHTLKGQVEVIVQIQKSFLDFLLSDFE